MPSDTEEIQKRLEAEKVRSVYQSLQRQVQDDEGRLYILSIYLVYISWLYILAIYLG